jgi:DNA-binding NtrC family response regulator
MVAATNKNLSELMQRGDFREDLYYRLNAIEVRLPPLRDRLGDIPAFVQYFTSKCNREAGRRIVGVTPEAMRALVSHPWPGNIRQLEQVIFRAVLLTKGPLIAIDDLPGGLTHERPVGPEGLGHVRQTAQRRAVDELLPNMLRDYLVSAGGNVSEAARKAGYSRVHFHRLMKKHGIRRPT